MPLIKKETFEKALKTIERYYMQENHELQCEQFKISFINPIRNHVNKLNIKL